MLVLLWSGSGDGVAAKQKDLQSVFGGPCVGGHSERHSEGGSAAPLLCSCCTRCACGAAAARWHGAGLFGITLGGGRCWQVWSR